MADLADGMVVHAADFPPSVYDGDDTAITNLSNTSYVSGAPEVGVVFTAPTSGRVRLTVGGGLRDSSGVDRMFLAPELFQGVDSSGTQVISPSVIPYGVGTPPACTEFHYSSRSSLLTGLTPGEVYYVRVMHLVGPGGASPNGTADVGSRDITVIPVP